MIASKKQPPFCGVLTNKTTHPIPLSNRTPSDYIPSSAIPNLSHPTKSFPLQFNLPLSHAFCLLSDQLPSRAMPALPVPPPSIPFYLIPGKPIRLHSIPLTHGDCRGTARTRHEDGATGQSTLQFDSVRRRVGNPKEEGGEGHLRRWEYHRARMHMEVAGGIRQDGRRARRRHGRTRGR